MSSAVRPLNKGLDVLETIPPSPRAASENTLAELGLEVERGPDVAAILRVLAGLVTAGGHARQTRLGFCGVAYPVLTEDGDLVWARRGCRDRFCPDCGAALGRRLAAAVSRRAARAAQVLSITVTRPKVSAETPGQALGAVGKAFSKLATSPLFRSRGKTGPAPALPGGVRMLECTAREAGQRVGTYVVAERGIHAHMHVIAELRVDWTLERATEELVATWQKICQGAEAGGQKITMLAAADIERACNYGVNFAKLAKLVDIAPNYARAVAAAMTGRVLVKAWGSWRSVLKPIKSGARFGDRSITSICQAPGGIVRFGDQVWQAGDVYRRLLMRPRKMGDE